MNKNILIFILFATGCVFLYLIYHSVASELNKQKSMEANKTLIIGRLDTLRLMQLAYCDVHAKYAPTFDTLFDYMLNGKYLKIKQIQSSSNDSVVNDTSFLNPMEVILGNSSIDLNHFKFIDKQLSDVFLMEASTINENGVNIPVFEISTPIGANIKKQLKVGDLNTANTNGNWK